MNLRDVYRTERTRWATAAPPDTVFAWFIHEGAGGQQQWSGATLRLSRSPRAGVFTRRNGPDVVGPWLTVSATSEESETSVDCAIAPAGSCWWWLAMGVLIPGTIGLGSLAVLLGSSASAAFVAPVRIGIVSWTVIWLGSALTFASATARTGADNRAWAHRVLHSSVMALAAQPGAPGASTSRTSAVSTGAPALMAPYPVELIDDGLTAGGRRFGTTTRRFRVDLPVATTRDRFLRTPPFWAVDDAGQLRIQRPLSRRSSRSRSSGIGWCECLVTLRRSGNSTIMEATISSRRGVLRFARSVTMFFGFAALLTLVRDDPHLGWTVAVSIAFIVPLLVVSALGTPKLARQLDQAFVATAAGIGAVEEPSRGP